MGLAAGHAGGEGLAVAQAPQPVALVTGAANGIGRAVAKHLLAAGWRLCVVDLPKSGLSRVFSKQSRKVLLLEGNVADEETATRAVKSTAEHFGRLDGLVSNAGIMIRKPIRLLTLTEWHRVLDVNLTATFLLTRAAEKMLRKANGAIVTIASTRALMSEPNTESYSASKGGVVALTHALAVSLGPNIRVNCVSPGWIETKDYGALRRKDHLQHPAGRVGKPTDIAQVVAWLLDREKSGFVTGANIIVDGGMTRKMIYEE
jgi:NAD(P)-dependent dehydrogenase (short-subunit alcohol dehydrogenase family)